MGARTEQLKRAIREKPVKPTVATKTEPILICMADVKPAPAPKPPRKPNPPRMTHGGPHQRDLAQANAGRLPDGAEFEARYDAETVTWRGTLTIGVQVFRAEAGGVFKLLAKLDGLYREWVATSSGGTATGHASPEIGATPSCQPPSDPA